MLVLAIAALSATVVLAMIRAMAVVPLAVVVAMAHIIVCGSLAVNGFIRHSE